jgi:hypothetical protein
MKTCSRLRNCLWAALLPAALAAQSIEAPSSTEFFVPQQGSREIIVGGSGASSKDFDQSVGGIALSYGSYLSQTLEVLLRQTVDYSNPGNAGAAWNGSTKLAIDQHFISEGRVRPFLGVNAGRIYGESVRDTWSAGVEGGAKFYVQPRTFIAATVEYGWLFEHAKSVNDRFDDGQWNWSLAVGFNF